MKYLSGLAGALGRLRVGQQLFAAFGIVLLLSATIGAVALVSLSRVEAQAEGLSSKWLTGVGHLSTMREAVVTARALEVKHSRTDDRSYHGEYEEGLKQATQQVAAALSAYEALVADTTEREAFGQLRQHWQAYEQASAKVIGLGREKKQQDAADISDGMASMAFDELGASLETLTHANFEGGKAAAAKARETNEQARATMLALIVVAVLLGAGLSAVITRQLMGQLGGEPRTAAEVARAVAGGDLGTPIRLTPGDHDSLMAQLSAMQHSLARTVSAVRTGSESVATASAQIAQGNLDLSGRTERQASSLQETTANMQALGQTVVGNADNARQASQFALSASAVAVKGGEVVGQVVQTMSGINDSSRKIGDIIGVIDGIAFQTNILALNAAVEAARAGEQGRGFAVVAGEVRSLAQRSAEAARQIKGLITTSVERVDHGSELVGRAGETMQEIVTAIRRVTDIVGNISAASQEQSEAVSQVGRAVSEMDQTTQQNAALVEQSASAAESLRQQAEQLVQAVAVFRLPSTAR